MRNHLIRLKNNKWFKILIALQFAFFLFSCQNGCFPLFDIDTSDLALYSCDHRAITQVVISTIENEDSCYYIVKPKKVLDRIDLNFITSKDFEIIKHGQSGSSGIEVLKLNRTYKYDIEPFPYNDRAGFGIKISFDKEGHAIKEFKSN